MSKLEETIKNNKEYNLTESKTFCMFPFAHLNIRPSGNVFPCCVADETTGMIGNVSDGSLKELWNNDKMKQYRLDMINDVEIPECTRCYKQEKNYGGSYRGTSIEKLAKHYDIVEKTNPDGSLDNFDIKYADFRLSNLCNLKCRMCALPYSTSWYDDTIELLKLNKKDHPKHIRAIDKHPDLWSEIVEVLENVEELYFAGGEPLLMKEQWDILQHLVKIGRNKDVKIWYSTNFTVHKYKNNDIFEYWNHFPNVTVEASLDSSYNKAEYLRHGCSWETIVNNRKLLQEKAPHVEFHVSSAISNVSVYSFIDFVHEWIALGYVVPDKIVTSPVFGPEYLNLENLPEEHRLICFDKVNNAKEQYKDNYWLHTRLEGLANILEQPTVFDKEQFIYKIKELDRLRNENFLDVFPEFSFLKEDF